MNSMITSPFLDRQPVRSARDEILLGYGERRALEAQEWAERKRLEYAEQCSVQNSPDVRIRAWETVHQLRMPATQLHPVLTAIAAATQLTMAEVRAEQQRRCEQRPSADV
jgi:hypothetical protein